MERPHLLLITTDQQRGDCLGCGGHPVVETPYLDDLARRGARFEHAYTAVPSCTPARAGLITGMDQWNHGRLTMAGGDYLQYPATLPGELARAGYHTQLVGKAHHHPQRALYGFHNMVLDESGREESPRFKSDYRAWFDEHKQGPYGYRDHSVNWNSWMARPSHLPEHLHPTSWTATEGVNFVGRRDPTKPMFLWLSFARPHSPYDPPHTYYDMYINHPDIPMPAVGDWAEPFDKRVDDIDAAWSRRSPAEIRRARAAYYGSVTFIDHQIGRFLHEFQRTQPKAFANTLIIFTSDHGDMLGDHHHWRKCYAYEGSARVPFIVQWPEAWGLTQGQVRSEPVELRDVMPTLLEAAGVDVPASVDGQSVLALIRDEQPKWREFVQGEHTWIYGPGHGMQYVTDGREKYIWFHDTDTEQFFDLQKDPRELHDLAQDQAAAERIAVWRRRLADINEGRGDPRGKDGKLIPQPNNAIQLSPNYYKWKELGVRVLEQNGR